jgi:hypothetical protein
MNPERRLKSPKMGLEWLPALIALPSILIVMYLWGIQTVWGFIAIIEFPVVLMHLNNYLRTRNIWFLLLAGAFSVIVLIAVYIYLHGMQKNDPGLRAAIVALLFTLSGIAFILFTKKIKWRTREIFELAAKEVNDAGNGFTGRPFSFGVIETNAPEIAMFSHFVSKNLLAIPYNDNGNTIYSLTSSRWKQYGLKRGWEDESWISLSSDGVVNVSISKEDYLKYQDTYSFDQLCQALGKTFTGFFELYRKGEGVRVLDRLDALKFNPITE